MGRVTRSAARQWDRTRRQASMPSWSTRLGVVIGVVVLIYLAVSLFSSSKAPQFAVNPVVVTTPVSTPSGANNPGPGFVTSGGVSVTNSSGQTVSIAPVAYDEAQRGAVAYLTGNWQQVDQAIGLSSPVAGQTWASAAVVSAMTPSVANPGGVVGQGGTGSLTLNFVLQVSDGSRHSVSVRLVTPDHGKHWLVQSVS